MASMAYQGNLSSSRPGVGGSGGTLLTGGKYTTLPRISTSLEQVNSRVVPYVENGGSDVDERLRLLETRLVVTEKSNRALLDEVVRLQNELMAVSRRNEESIREERQNRKYIENSVRSNQGLFTDLSNRLKSTEEALAEERHSLSDLLSQARGVEQQMMSNSQETSIIKDRYITKVNLLEKEVEEINRDRTKLERVSFQLVDELRTLKTKLESQGYDFSTIANDLRSKSKRMEDEYQHNLDTMKKHLDRQDGDSGSTQHIRQLLDQRLAELRDITVHLRTRLDEEIGERRSLEQAVNQRMSEFNRSIAEQNRLREETLHNIQALNKERDHRTETEKMAVQNRITEAVEEINGKILEKELKLREEQMKRHTELEKVLRTEQEGRINYERELRADTDRKWENVKRLQAEEMIGVKDQLRHDRDRYQESARRLDDAVTLLEKQIDETKRDITKVLTAEIKTRSSKDKEFKGRLEELEEKISAATAALQQAISGISNTMVQNQEKVGTEETRKLMNDMLEEYRKEMTRQIGDLDARLLGLKNRIMAIDDQVDTKVADATATLHASVREKMESISLWQAGTNANINELRIQKQTLQDEIYRAQEGIELLKSEINSRVGAEISGRVEDVDSVRREIETIKTMLPRDMAPTKAEMDQDTLPRIVETAASGDFATVNEVEQVQASIRKLAESMQTVKTVLGMKIQSEQKLRLEEVKNLQDELIRLRTTIEPLIHMKLEPRLFVKPDEISVNRDVAEMASPAVNKWSLYNTFRWLKWKSKLMYFKWSITHRARASEENNSPFPADLDTARLLGMRRAMSTYPKTPDSTRLSIPKTPQSNGKSPKTPKSLGR